MVKYPKIIRVTAAIIESDKKILIAQRKSDDDIFGGLWEFPGGKKEKNETPSECLIREIKEEIGINIKDSDLSPITFTSYEYDNFSILLLLFSCREWNGILVAKENQELGWFSPLDLYKLELLPADKGLIEKAVEQDVETSPTWLRLYQLLPKLIVENEKVKRYLVVIFAGTFIAC